MKKILAITILVAISQYTFATDTIGGVVDKTVKGIGDGGAGVAGDSARVTEDAVDTVDKTADAIINPFK